MAGFTGTRGTSDFVADQRPKNWRDMMLRLYPNGKMPLTAFTSMLRKEKTDDPEFNWWTKALPTQAGDITELYSDAGLTSAYAGGTAAAGTVFYVKVALETASHFRAGHTAYLVKTGDYRYDHRAKVISVIKNGANSVIAVKLLAAETATYNLAGVDRIMVMGSVNAEGAEMPTAISYDPTKFYNYTQIFRTPLDITRTARKTRLRTGDAYQEAKMEALELHGIEMERAFLFGVATEGTGENGKPERTTDGFFNFLKTNASANVSSYKLDANYAGKMWLQGGKAWLDAMLKKIFTFGDSTKACICGNGAVSAIGMLAETYGTINLEVGQTAFGMKITRWITPFGEIEFRTHPLFNYEVSLQNTALIFEPNLLKYRYIDDTTFKPDNNSQNSGSIDGTQEEYLTECGLEFHHPSACGILFNMGENNTVVEHNPNQ